MAKPGQDLLRPPRADRMAAGDPYRDDQRGKGLFWLLFSFRGRLSRGGYWLGSLLLGALCGGAFALALRLGLGPEWTMQVDVDDTHRSYDIASHLDGPLFPILFCVVFYCQLALVIKRWHDRGRSAALLAVAFFPFLGPLWIGFELLFLRGTDGPNRFGDDPAVS